MADLETMRDSIKADIAELDEKLDSVLGGDTAGKRAISNELVNARKGSWSKVTEPLIAQLNEMSDEDLVGSYLGFKREFDNAFKNRADALIQKLYDAQPQTEKVEMPEAELKAIASKRSEKYGNFKQLRELALGFADDKDEVLKDPAWDMPAVRRANVGKRGKRPLSQMTWVIDGNELDPNETTPKDVAEALGFEKKEGEGGSVSAQLTAALKALNINTTKPGTGFEVEINGHTVVASREVAEEDNDDDEEETETEDED